MSDNFPTIQRPSSRVHNFIHKQQKRQFEDGKISSRKVFTSGMWEWELKWEYMSKSDFDAVQDHFNRNLGSVFYCTQELLGTDVGYNVRYSEDKLKKTSTKAKGFFGVTLKFEEAL